MRKPVTIDFETEGIEARPKYPPLPAGVAIKYPGRRAQYYAWGHDTGNNCTRVEGEAALKKAWSHVTCQHNSKFDLDVARAHFGLPWPKEDAFHDTMVLAYLNDPHSKAIDLKSLSVKYLGRDPTERDELKSWILKNVPGARASDWEKHIARAPGDLVGRYACADVEMSESLFDVLYKRVVDAGMSEAYLREKALLEVLVGMEGRGIPVDVKSLKKDLAKYEGVLSRISEWIKTYLGVSGDFNVDSAGDLADALDAAGKASNWMLTPTGKRSTSKDSLRAAVSDATLTLMLDYRSTLANYVQNFMSPWCRVATETGGCIYTQWHSTKQEEKGGSRTGRLSSTPNLQNVPSHERWVEGNMRFTALFEQFDWVPQLPNIRSYIVAGPGHVIIDRDYCFHPSTEILTESGWSTFQDLRTDTRVAQYHEGGGVSYVVPTERQVLNFSGDLVHIHGTSVDLLVTPNHNCLLSDPAGALRFVGASDYAREDGSRSYQLHAGLLPGHRTVDPDVLRLACALQADATLRNASTFRWKLKKQRKVDRLVGCLQNLGVAHKSHTYSSAPGFTWITVSSRDLPAALWEFVSRDREKVFCRRALLDLVPDLRRLFLRELALWDGSQRTTGSWYYSTTNRINAETVQEVASLSGVRALFRSVPVEGKKTAYWVVLRSKDRTSIRRYKNRTVRYGGPVYCVTVPTHMIVVRRNGVVSVTGQSQQEPRALAHFEDGVLCEAYKNDPRMDIYVYGVQVVRDMTGILLHPDPKLARKYMKTIILAIMYGLGLGKLAERLGITVDEARKFKSAILRALPGVKMLTDDLKRRGRDNLPMTTWGGRRYFAEPSKIVDGQLREYGYKLVNYLIQGSSADMTKEAMVRYQRNRKHGELMISVHDELVVRCPREHYKTEMEILKTTMDTVELDAPLVSDGEMGTRWGDLKEMS